MEPHSSCFRPVAQNRLNTALFLISVSYRLIIRYLSATENGLALSFANNGRFSISDYRPSSAQ